MLIVCTFCVFCCCFLFDAFNEDVVFVLSTVVIGVIIFVGKGIDDFVIASAWLLVQSLFRVCLYCSTIVILRSFQRWNRLYRSSFSKDVVLSTIVISGIIFCLFIKGGDDIYHGSLAALTVFISRLCCTDDFAEI